MPTMRVSPNFLLEIPVLENQEEYQKDFFYLSLFFWSVRVTEVLNYYL